MTAHIGASHRRVLHWQSRVICLLAAMLCADLSAQAQTDLVNPPAGGPGGSPFVARCPQGRYLTGFELRGGAVVDAIRPICVVAYGPAETGPLEPYPTMFGGPGGGTVQLLCPRDFPIVQGVMLGIEGTDGVVVHDIPQLVCGTATLGKQKTYGAGPVFLSTGYSPVTKPLFPEKIAIQDCPNPQDNFDNAAVGITGRSGESLDAMGLICNMLELTPKPVALGRVTAGAPSPPLRTMGGEAPICARARDARARNSPVAPSLETQCLAAGGNFSDRAVSRPESSQAGAVSALHAGPGTPSPADRYTNTRFTRVRAGASAVEMSGAMQSQPAEPGSLPAAPTSSHAFTPPAFADGAQLWACLDAAHAHAGGAACDGFDSGVAYCRLQGFSGVIRSGADGADLTLEPAQAGSRIRAINGDACAGNSCVVISELHCLP